MSSLQPQVAIFGGAFDPPHLGHSLVIQQILTHKVVDQVVLMPSGSHPFQKKMSSEQHRLQMLELMVASLIDTPRVVISDYELKRQQTSYSYETLKAFSQQDQNAQYCWLIGSDLVPHFHLWKNYQAILKNYGVLVYPRAGYEDVRVLPGMKWLGQVDTVSVSSSQVRDQIKKGESVTGLLGQAVAEYSERHLLYLKE